MAEWWREKVLSGQMDNQIKDMASSSEWELDEDGKLPDGRRGQIANMPGEIHRQR